MATKKMSDEDEHIFDEQLEVIKRLESFISNFGKSPKDRINLGYLSSRAAGLKEIWGEFIQIHKRIKLVSTPEDYASQTYFTENHFDKYEAAYYDCLGRISQKQFDLTSVAVLSPVGSIPTTFASTSTTSTSSASISSAPTTSASNVPVSIHAPANPIYNENDFNQREVIQEQLQNPVYLAHQIQIPRLNVPIFCGSYDDWPSFRDLFMAAVHTNQNLQPVHKLQYLKSLLKGNAETILKYIPTTSDNYTVAWRKLEERFDNKRALITNTLRKLFSQPQAEETASSIRQLLDTSNECINALQTQGIAIDTWDCILIFIISQRIPTTSLNLWEQSLQRNQLPSIEHLFNFLDDRFRTLEFVPPSTSSTQNRARSKPQSFHTTTSTCRVCHGTNHPLRKCPKFIELQPNQRLNHVTKSRLCKNCFAFSHQTAACKSSGTCNICGERHHSLLHLGILSETSIPVSNLSTGIPENAVALSAPIISQASAHISRQILTTSDNSLLATALVSIKAFDGKILTFRALLDNCSQENFISKRLMNFIGIKPKPTSMVIGGIGQSQAPKPLGKLSFTFSSLQDESFSMTVEATVLLAVTHPLPTKTVLVDQTFIAGLNLADPTYGTPGNIDILLSSTVFAALTIPCVKKDSAAATVAMQTKLGWVLYGEAIENSNHHQRACFHTTSEDQVSAALQEFWRIEEISAPPSLTPDDQKCEEIFASTHTRNLDGRYCVQLPFKQFPPILGASRDRAVTRFLQVERKLIANPQLYNEYKKCINEYLQLGHMHPLKTPEPNHQSTLPNGRSTHMSYYLPHHAVIKMESTTTKLRVVFDASSIKRYIIRRPMSARQFV